MSNAVSNATSASVECGAADDVAALPPVVSSRQALELRLEATRERNRKLRAQLDMQSVKNSELQASLVASSVAAEVEEEHISNSLLRRLDSLRKDKDHLDAQLQQEERRKEEQEMLLSRLKNNRVALERHLRQEEVEIADKLQKQLHHTHLQRLELQSKVTAESATLQQLHDCIRSLRDGFHPSPALSPAKQPPPPLSSVHLGGSMTCHSDPQEATGADGLIAPLSCSTTSALRASGAAEGVGETADASPLANRSPSTTSASASGAREGGNAVTTPLGGSTSYSEGTPLTYRRSFTADNGMLRLLESEIQVAESLRKDAERRVREHGERVAKLKEDILDAERAREAQRTSVDQMRAELVRTTSAVSELHANQEVALEWNLDRELLGGGGPSGHHHYRSSSVCSTVSSHSLAAIPEMLPVPSDALFAPKVLHAVHQPLARPSAPPSS